jgi:hypothetical protein
VTEIEQGIAISSVSETRNHILESPFIKRLAAGMAGVALAAGIVGEHADSAVAAGKHQPSAEWSLVQPDNLTVLKQEQACTPKHQVKLSLYKNRTSNNETDTFMVRARYCKKAGRPAIKNVVLKNDSDESKHEAWKIKSLRPGKTKSFTFTLPALKRTASDTAPSNDKQNISLKAVAPKKGQLGHNVWTLRNSPSSDDLSQPPHIPDPEVVKQALANCTPDPDFKVGIQDDPQSVFERDINRNQLFDLGKQIFNASYVRINMIYGLVQQVGLQPYIDAVNAAKANGYKVDMTLMPTPSYMPSYDQTLNYKNWDPQMMQSFAQTIGATFGNSVEDYSIGNEVNHPYFNADESMPRFKAAFLAGRAGLLAAYPQAKILIGELAPVDVSDWIDFLNTLPNDGIAIHPYGDTINHLPTYISKAKTPLYLTEYGNFRSPNQMENNKAAEILARCTGTKRLTMYQVIHNTDKVGSTTGWDTGVVDPPPRQ